MKRKLALIILCCTIIFSVCGMVACNIGVHTHELEKVEATAATCTEAGNKEYYRCKSCDKIFADEDYTEINLEETVIAALGHELEHHDGKSATCTEDGTIEYWSCSLCNKNFSDKAGANEVESVVIKALDHDFSGTETVITPATCQSKGSKTVKCTRCDETTTVEIAINPDAHDLEHHDGKSATCTEAGYKAYETCKHEGCKYSTYEEISALGHSYQSTEVPATETEDGYTLFKCSGCNDEYKVYSYYGVDSNVAISSGMKKNTADNRVEGKGTLTYRVETSTAIRVKLYVNVSSTGSIFGDGLALSTVISSVSINGTGVSGYSAHVPTGSDVYADYLIGEVDLIAGKNLIEVTVGEYSWAGPFFRGISISTTDVVKIVEPFDGYTAKAVSDEVFVVGGYKDTSNDRIYPNTGANAMSVTVGVKTTKACSVDLYAIVSGHGFDETVLLMRVISALSVNGSTVAVEETVLPKATDVYDNYKMATVELNEGENVISLTSEHLAYFGPFFRGIMVASLDKIEFYNAVPTFGGYDEKVEVTEGMVQQPEACRVCGQGTMTYKINASKAGTAKLFVTISSMGVLFDASNVNEVITEITVNGNAVVGYSDLVPAGSDLYIGFYIGEITLQEGENVITVTDGKYSWAGPYFRSISLTGDATFTLLDANA